MGPQLVSTPQSLSEGMRLNGTSRIQILRTNIPLTPRVCDRWSTAPAAALFLSLLPHRSPCCPRSTCPVTMLFLLPLTMRLWHRRMGEPSAVSGRATR